MNPRKVRRQQRAATLEGSTRWKKGDEANDAALLLLPLQEPHATPLVCQLSSVRKKSLECSAKENYWKLSNFWDSTGSFCEIFKGPLNLRRPWTPSSGRLRAGLGFSRPKSVFPVQNGINWDKPVFPSFPVQNWEKLSKTGKNYEGIHLKPEKVSKNVMYEIKI